MLSNSEECGPKIWQEVWGVGDFSAQVGFGQCDEKLKRFSPLVSGLLYFSKKWKEIQIAIMPS